MTRVLIALVIWLGWALPASAQAVRTFLTVPVNFKNDASQPRTLAQLKADSEVLGKLVFGVQNTYGAVTTTSTVLNYLTIDMDKGCPGKQIRTLPALNMDLFRQKVKDGLIARAEADPALGTTLEKMTGYAYVYIVSPTTFNKCSHTSSYGINFDYPLSAGEAGTILTWRMGLRYAVDWLCRASAGSSTFVTFSDFCGPNPSNADGRNFTSLPGQGSDPLAAADRARFGWLPASHQETVPIATTRGQWTLRYLENPAEGLKRLSIPAMRMELEYHAPKSGVTRWDTRGVTAHLLGTSYRLDFTPDNKWLFGTTALEPGASWVYNGLRLTTLSADLDVAVVDLRPASDPLPTIPTGPRCATTSQDPSINVTTVTDGTCGVWKIDSARRVYRAGFFAGYADSITFCHGVVYVPNGALWSRYVSNGSAAVMVPMNAPATPPCDASPLPPPEDARIGLFPSPFSRLLSRLSRVRSPGDPPNRYPGCSEPATEGKVGPMADILDSLGELEGHEFTHAGQVYSIVTVTANRMPLDEAIKGDQGPIHIHFTVTSAARQEPIGLTLLLASQTSNDLAYVREHVENRVRSIVDGGVSSGQIEHV